MNMLYFVFALIPVVTIAVAFLPEITGRGEAVPVGGFEYSIYLSKKWLVLSGFGVSFFGTVFLLAFENTAAFELFFVSVVLGLALAFEAASLCAFVFYFQYRVTVCGTQVTCRLPLRREFVFSFSEIDGYSAVKRKNGNVALRIKAKGRIFTVFGRGTELLLRDLETRGIKKL